MKVIAVSQISVPFGTTPVQVVASRTARTELRLRWTPAHSGISAFLGPDNTVTKLTGYPIAVSGPNSDSDCLSLPIQGAVYAVNPDTSGTGLLNVLELYDDGL